MTSVITPTSQAAHVNAFSNRIFEFDTISSKYYIARTVNENLLAHGTDCVLTGLDIYFVYNPFTFGMLEIFISPGRAIVDTTLIEILEWQFLSINVSAFDDSGSFVLFLSYRFLETPLQNPASLKLFYINPTGDYTVPEQFETDRDRLLLGHAYFDKTNESCWQNVATYRDPIIITIHNKPYLLRPMSDLKRGTLDEMYERFKLVDI